MRYAEVLRGGNPRTLRGSEQVLADLRAHPQRVGELIDCCCDADEVVRMRAADALEKFAREEPDLVAAQLERLFAELGPSRQPSVQWHVAQILGEVPLTSAEQQHAATWLCQTLDEASDWIVLSHALSSLAILVTRDPSLRPAALERIQRHADDPRKAVAKRAVKALRLLR